MESKKHPKRGKKRVSFCLPSETRNDEHTDKPIVTIISKALRCEQNPKSETDSVQEASNSDNIRLRDGTSRVEELHSPEQKNCHSRVQNSTSKADDEPDCVENRNAQMSLDKAVDAETSSPEIFVKVPNESISASNDTLQEEHRPKSSIVNAKTTNSDAGGWNDGGNDDDSTDDDTDDRNDGDDCDEGDNDEKVLETSAANVVKPRPQILKGAQNISDNVGSRDDSTDLNDVENDDGTSTNPGVSVSQRPREGVRLESVESAEPVTSFSELNLDPRLERAVEKIGWRKPTPVQGTVLPNALRGRDVLVTAPTGSGKTAAYAIPIVQHVCQAKALSNLPPSAIYAVVLVPTRELVQQVASVLKDLCRFIAGVRVHKAVSGKGSSKRPRKRSKDKKTADNVKSISPLHGMDIVVGTPASVRSLQAHGSTNPFSATGFFVIDEADLILSYGYEKDAHWFLSIVSSSAQCMLLSATLAVDRMDSLCEAVLRNPQVVKITSSNSETLDDSVTGASHYVSRLKNYGDRFLVTYAMLRLKVLCGKVLIFVNHINSAFRLKLFLDQFKLKSAVLNAELPANSRIHCVQQFNAGVFDTLIAVDGTAEDDTTSVKRKRNPGKKRKIAVHDEEFGLSRGIDFKDVAAVLNYDVSSSAESYTHRAGRTARGGKSGTVLSFVCSDHEETHMKTVAQKLGVHVGPLAFRMEQVEPFRYRVEDCLRLITDSVVRGARLADVRREIEMSEQLKGYFEDKPEDLDALQHNVQLAKKVPEHLAHVPNYLLPIALRQPSISRGSGMVDGKGKMIKRHGNTARRGSKFDDPLKSLSLRNSSRARFQRRHGIQKKSKSDEGLCIRKPRKYQKK